MTPEQATGDWNIPYEPLTAERAALMAAAALDMATDEAYVPESAAALVAVADGWMRLHTALATTQARDFLALKTDPSRAETSHRPSELTTAEKLAKISIAAIGKVRHARDTQGRPGNWDADEYMRGLYNGLELAVSILEGERAPDFRSEPASGYRKPKVVLNTGSAPFTDKGQG